MRRGPAPGAGAQQRALTQIRPTADGADAVPAVLAEPASPDAAMASAGKVFVLCWPRVSERAPFRRLATDQMAVRPPSAAKTAPVM